MDFPVNPKRPKDKDNTIPLFGVRWTSLKGRACSNAWTTKAEARRVMADLKTRGCEITGTSTSYCAGFAPFF